jgi:4'-phosphopantetheinyl transferase
MTADDSCLVWWAAVTDYRPGHDRLLSDVEVARSGRMHRAEDRIRQRLGAVLLRLAAGAALGQSPQRVHVDRRCPRCSAPHGRPLLPGTGLHASITHSGELVGLALTGVAPVGLDVERITDVDLDGLAGVVLHPDERAPDRDAFFTYWTRKEAVVKATGDGLAVPLTEVRVTTPGQRPALLTYPGRDGLPAHLIDLRPADGYRAALAVLTSTPVPVAEHPAAGLLGSDGTLPPATPSLLGSPDPL